MTRPSRNAPTRPLSCHRCGADESHLHVPGAGNFRQVRGQRRKATYVRCPNGHEFWSVHPRALELGREADKAARAAA